MSPAALRQAELEALWDMNQRVEVLGGPRVTGATESKVRWLASAKTEHVQVHVQSNAGGGGGVDYNAAVSISSTRVNCRENRQQETTVGRNALDRYYLWLIPVWEATPGVYVKFDGVEQADRMAVVDLGV